MWRLPLWNLLVSVGPCCVTVALVWYHAAAATRGDISDPSDFDNTQLWAAGQTWQVFLSYLSFHGQEPQGTSNTVQRGRNEERRFVHCSCYSIQASWHKTGCFCLPKTKDTQGMQFHASTCLPFPSQFMMLILGECWVCSVLFEIQSCYLSVILQLQFGKKNEGGTQGWEL